MSRRRQRDSVYRPSPLSRQLTIPNFSDSGVDGEHFDPLPNVCTCLPQPCNIPTDDLVDHPSIYIHYLAMMQSLGISGPSELQSILAGGGGKPELTAQLKTSLACWVHLGWFKGNTIVGDDGDTLGQEASVARRSGSDELIPETGTKLNDNPKQAERRDSSESDTDDEMGGVLVRQHMGSPYMEGVYDDYVSDFD